ALTQNKGGATGRSERALCCFPNERAQVLPSLPSFVLYSVFSVVVVFFFVVPFLAVCFFPFVVFVAALWPSVMVLPCVPSSAYASGESNRLAPTRPAAISVHARPSFIASSPSFLEGATRGAPVSPKRL